MKKIYSLLFFLAILVFGCSKDDLMDNNQGFRSLNNSTLSASASVFEVYDTGTDETQALIDAFNAAKAAGKGSVVKLMPGTFETGMIEVRDFDGILSGSGKGTTIINPVADLSPDDLLAQNKLPSLLTFIGGNITISDLSVVMTERYSWLGSSPFSLMLFSDYSTDYLPPVKHIVVSINNAELTGILQEDVLLWEGGPVLDYPYSNLAGAKIAPDVLQLTGTATISRCNADGTVTNSEFENFQQGFVIWGLGKGNIEFGKGGGNSFAGNNQGLVVNQNMGLNIKIWNNTFDVPDYNWNGIDVNTIDEDFFINEASELGNYDVRYNSFNIHIANGMGMWDYWQYQHPEHPVWMKMIWDRNTFNCLADGAWIGVTYNMKNVLYSNNTITGVASEVIWYNLGTSWIDPDDPNYLYTFSTGCKFLNNHFLQKNVWFLLEFDTKDYLVQGDLSNVIVEDWGVNNRIIGKVNPNHANGTLPEEFRDRLERIHQMLTK